MYTYHLVKRIPSFTVPHERANGQGAREEEQVGEYTPYLRAVEE
jgi:hypothetical protein